MKKIVIGCVVGFLFAACDPGPVVDESELNSSISSEVDDVLADSDEPQQPDAEVDANQVNIGDTAMSDVDSEQGVGSVVVDTDEVVDDTEEIVSDVDGNSVTTDEIAVDVDTEEEVVDTEEEVVDTEEEVVDTEEEVVDTEEEVVDTEEEVVDTEEEVVDTEAEACTPALVINEVDYDVPGTDTSEFVELYNPSDCAVSLQALALVFVNGSNSEEYRRVALIDAGVDALLPGEFLVVSGSDLVLAEDVIGIQMTLASGFIQNGPDGIAVIDVLSQTIMDSFCYKGPLDAVLIDNIEETVNLVEGTMNFDLKDSSAEGVSLGRSPEGADSNSAVDDWFVTVATPGAANQIAE